MWASNVGNMQACCLCEGRSDLCFVFASCGFKKWLHDPHFAAVSQTSLYSAHHNLTNSNWLAEVMLKDSVHHHFAHGAASPPSGGASASGGAALAAPSAKAAPSAVDGAPLGTAAGDDDPPVPLLWACDLESGSDESDEEQPSGLDFFS